MSVPTIPASAPATPEKKSRSRRARHATALLAHGEPAVWGTGGALVISIVMILGLLVLVVVQGLPTFWPGELVQIRTLDGRTLLGEVRREETYQPAPKIFDSLPAQAQEKARAEVARAGGTATRHLLRTGNFDLAGTHHQWVSDFQIAEETTPPWSLVVERFSWGNFYGTPTAFLVDGKVMTDQPEEIWNAFCTFSPEVLDRLQKRVSLERHGIGAVSREENNARLAVRQAEISYGKGSPQWSAAEANYLAAKKWSSEEYERITETISSLNRQNERFKIRLVTGDGQEKSFSLDQIVRAYPANQLGFWDKTSIYFSRWRDFLTQNPRNANTEGGVFPAIWGTISMTLLMSLAVVPFGVLAALYLREYAKSGPIISAVRIAINNLAGVPSIVFGVFGLGFFCYLMGAFIDGGPRGIQVNPWPEGAWWLGLLVVVIMSAAAFFAGLSSGRQAAIESRRGKWLGPASLTLWLLSLGGMVYLLIRIPYFQGFFQAELPSPTFGTGGVLWAALTLALLTLPVVIVATEEALAAVPNSMREGSYACGASKWQTIHRIVLPRALPGIMTGMILAMARGAGEVAPLMLVGAVNVAPHLPVDGVFPFLHAERSFMHLGLHIFELGFQSPDSEAARPMVYATTLLLIAIVALLNLTAVWLRARLRRRYLVSQF